MKFNKIKFAYTSAGTVDYRRGDEIRPTSVGTICEASKILGDLIKKPIGLYPMGSSLAIISAPISLYIGA